MIGHTNRQTDNTTLNISISITFINKMWSVKLKKLNP